MSLPSPNTPRKDLFLFRSAVFCAFLAVFLIPGCETYDPQFLDPAAHRTEWSERDASRESVEAFAERVGKSPSQDRSFDARDGLTLSEGQVVALIFNPDLRVARLRAGVARATAEHAGLWEDPVLSVDVLNVTQSVPDPWVIGSALAFTIPVSGRLEVEKARAEAEMHAELERVSEAEWEVIRDVAHDWLEWSAEGYKLEETRTFLGELNSVVDSTSRLVEAGELLRTEAALFSIEQASRRAERDRLSAAVEENEQKLRAVIGLSPSAPLKLVPRLSIGHVSNNQGGPNENHPTLARLRREHEVADKAFLREIKKQYPDITIGPQAESDEGQSRIGFIGAIPVPIFNSNKGGIAEARAQREVALAAYETEYERMTGQLAALRARLSGIRSRLSTFQKTLVPLVDRQVADADRLLGLGEGDSLVLLESLLRLKETKLQLIDLYLEEAQVLNEIRYLIGPDGWK